VVKSNTYKGAPLIIDVRAGQSDFNESKDVEFGFHLLLGEGKGDAYIEYWFRADYSGPWEKIHPEYLSSESWATDGITSNSGQHGNVWKAGDQLGNQVKTNNAQIRVTAYYGSTPSGWDGNGEFVVSTGGTSGGTGPAYELFDINDATGAPFWDVSDPAYASSIEKRDSILGNSGLVSVGTYNDGVQEYPVYDFTGYESDRDAFDPAYTTGHYFFAITDTNIIKVKLQSSPGN
jgi:hypothetical protein